jgi:membrane fusion protein, copper/silver efflux system
MTQNDSPGFHRARPGVSLVTIILVLVAFIIGYFLATSLRDAPTTGQPGQSAAIEPHDHDATKSGTQAKKPTVWTCSMHPQIKLPNPGKCPICFMDLIPLEDEHQAAADSGKWQYSMSETAKKLAEVETTPVQREQVKVVVRMVGLVTEDETRVAALTARVDGRLDEIYINFTGETVQQGDPMVKIWSPTLIKSQVELFESQRSEKPDSEVIKGAEEKLIQYGLTRDQIEQIRQQKRPILYLTLRAPINGVVMKKMAVLGQFVKEGQEMYTINDLSRVWVKLDAYETDIAWIRFGQDVTFTTPSVPGHKFHGKVLFIDPTLDMRTRSIKIRVEADNPKLTLKPGMFITAEVAAEIDSKGRIVKSEWAGKYICPVHPADTPTSEPGTCPDSKMPLRPASSYGYADDAKPELPLVIPSTAPLITGKRAVVYVEVPNTDRPTYQLRDVVLGPRGGDKYVVYEGLKEGERVVSHGNFKIDSAMQILAKPSMMSPPEQQPKKAAAKRPEEEVEIHKVTAPSAFLEGLTPTIGHYVALKDALVEEKTDEAAAQAEKVREAIQAMNAGLLDGTARETWDKLSAGIVQGLGEIKAAKEVSKQREAFGPMSEQFARLVMAFRHVMPDSMFLYYCPMAFDGEGAYWVQPDKDVRNPYFGHRPAKGQDMLHCGELTETIPPEPRTEKPATEPKAEPAQEPAGHEHGGH